MVFIDQAAFEVEQGLQDLEESLGKPPLQLSEDDGSADSTEIDGLSEHDSESDSDDVDIGVSPQQTLIIFDWDDTLLCSHWLRAQGLELDNGCVVSAAQQALLDSLATSAANALRQASRLGEVVLVTNAEHGWVEMSCSKFMPALAPLLKPFRVISARSTYELQGWDSPYDWKRLAFAAEIANFCKRPGPSQHNILSIGDSAHEREALIQATDQLQGCYVKAVKFALKPDVEQLQQEQELVASCLLDLVHHGGNLDLCLQ